MSEQLLTRDNLLLSRPKQRTYRKVCALMKPIALDELPQNVARYVEKSLAPNTLRAYEADLRHFQSWGGRFPCTDVELASYLASLAETHSVATVVRRLASISKLHTSQRFANAASSALVKATLRGIKRVKGLKQKPAQSLSIEHIRQIVCVMSDTLRDVRDKALLLLGNAVGFRRSELIGLDLADIKIGTGGLTICVRRSKTDQYQEGRVVQVPRRSCQICPVAALESWIRLAAISKGPIFRAINRHGHLGHDRLTGEAVSLAVKYWTTRAGLGPGGFSGHSLRVGCVTDSAKAGIPLWKIRQQTGHRSDDGVARYIRAPIGVEFG